MDHQSKAGNPNLTLSCFVTDCTRTGIIEQTKIKKLNFEEKRCANRKSITARVNTKHNMGVREFVATIPIYPRDPISFDDSCSEQLKSIKYCFFLCHVLNRKKLCKQNRTSCLLLITGLIFQCKLRGDSAPGIVQCPRPTTKD